MDCIISRVAACVLLLLSAGCASVSNQDTYDEVAAQTERRLPTVPPWTAIEPDSDDVATRTDELLESALDVASAIELALLNNPRVQQTFEQLGIAEAERVEAGLLENPKIGGSARLSSSPSGSIVELGIVQNLLELITRRARLEIADLTQERVELTVSQELVELASHVEQAYYDWVGSRHLVAVRTTILEASTASADLAQQIHAVGNTSELTFAQEQATQRQAHVSLRRAEASTARAREHFSRLLGVPANRLKVPDQLPEATEPRADLDDLLANALALRLDLAAAGAAVEADAAILGLTRRWRYLAALELGVEAERELDGHWTTGPHLEIALPIFDRGQAGVARQQALLRASERHLEGLAFAVRSEVQEAHEQLRIAYEVSRSILDELIPLREQIVARTQERYNFMLSGMFELIEAKEEQYEAYADYVEALREVHIAAAALRHAVGGSWAPASDAKGDPS